MDLPCCFFSLQSREERKRRAKLGTFTFFYFLKAAPLCSYVVWSRPIFEQTCFPKDFIFNSPKLKTNYARLSQIFMKVDHTFVTTWVLKASLFGGKVAIIKTLCQIGRYYKISSRYKNVIKGRWVIKEYL